MISKMLYLEDNFVVHVKFSVVEPIGETVIPPGALNKVALVLNHIGLLQVVALLSVSNDAFLKVHLVESVIKVEEVLSTTTPLGAVRQTLRLSLVEIVLKVAERWTVRHCCDGAGALIKWFCKKTEQN